LSRDREKTFIFSEGRKERLNIPKKRKKGRKSPEGNAHIRVRKKWWTLKGK